MDASIVIAALTLLTTAGGFWYTWKKDARDHAWLLEDQARKDATIAAAAAAAKDAYHEANQVNGKIADLQSQQEEKIEHLKALQERIDELKRTVIRLGGNGNGHANVR